MKCHLYTYCFSHFVNIFSHSRQFDDKCIAGFRVDEKIPSVCNLFTNKQHYTTDKNLFSLSVRANDALLCTDYLCDLFF